MKPNRYYHKKVESKWQKKWSGKNTFVPNIKAPSSTFYNLWMFPYPSAEGLHAGHVYASTGSDAYGKYMRMMGKSVFQPIGYDSFGIHSENFAIKIGEHPKKMLDRTTANYKKQLQSLGHGYDWTRTVTTSNVEYYKWTQWLFVQMFKAGLAYRKKATVNWCPSCKTVLSDEQVVTPAQAGKLPPGVKSIDELDEDVRVCERCGSIPEEKALEQWFFRITNYADRLLENLDTIDWPVKIKKSQKNWIGRSEGVRIEFEIKSSKLKIEVFTTAIDTVYGVSFMVLSPQHPLIQQLELSKEHSQKMAKYIEEHQIKPEDDNGKQKTGVFTGLYAINPINNKQIPIWIADYVLMDYGTGAVMGVPGHDLRDHDFAERFELDIVPVIKPTENSTNVGPDGFWDYLEIKNKFAKKSELFNSGEFSGLDSMTAKQKITETLQKRKAAKKQVHYHLRDWAISRQRYWGPPIPMIYCKACAEKGEGWFTNHDPLITSHSAEWNSAGWYPEDALPVELPTISDYEPEGTGRSPLAKHKEFYEVKCPGCGKDAMRETDVSDTFLDSAWYFLRYPSVGTDSPSRSESSDSRATQPNRSLSPHESQSTNHQSLPWSPEVTRAWLPVDLYFGGAEHAVLHLMYARFVTMALKDLKHVGFEEPFPRFFAHGLMIKDGAKMSKSKGNVVNPDEYIERFGADTLRLYVMFIGPMDGSPDFRDTGIEGMRRFLDRIWALFQNNKTTPIKHEDSNEVIVKVHHTIKKVSQDIEKFQYNTAIAALMELVNLLRQQKGVSIGSLKVLAQLLAPFAPHMTEEAWVDILKQDFSIHKSKWPKHNEKFLMVENVTVAIQINGKLRGQIEVEVEKIADKDYVLELAETSENVKKWLVNTKVKNAHYIEGRVVNFVVS